MLTRDISQEAFAAMPAYIADAQALRRSFLANPTQSDAEAVASAVRELTGIELSGPMNWIYLQRPGCDRYALLVVHRYTAPMVGEADLVIVSHRWVFSRTTFLDFALSLITDIGINRLIARIPADHLALQDLARRAGFKFEGAQQIEGAGLVTRWVTTPDDLLAFGRKG